MSRGGLEHIAFESLGVRLRLTSDSRDVLERIPAMIPPGSRAIPPSSAEHSFGVLADANGTYEFQRDDSPVTTGSDLEFALMLLDNQIRIFVGVHAPDRIFVHAGVVAHENRAVVLPGRSFTGKTTIVSALVRAGAVYYSDEFAVIDGEGLAHPYARPLSIRDQDEIQIDHAVETLGGIAGDTPLPIGAIVFAEYLPGAKWEPQPLSPGQAVLGLLTNTLAALERSEEALRVLTRAVEGAILLQGDRGEAGEIVNDLLSLNRHQ